MVRGHRRLFAGLVIAASLVGGCGMSVGEHESRYAAQLRAVQQQFTVNVQNIIAGTGSNSSAAPTTQSVGRYEDALARLELRLRAIHAPPTVSGLHRRLIETIDRYGAEVRRMIAALRTGNRTTLSLSGERFRQATLQLSRQVQTTLAQIDATLRREPGAVSP